ncbi:MAG: hypothetical protein R2863_10140 [Candidatus Kapaibacterium sp.]
MDKGYPLITSKNITNNTLDFSNSKLISKSDFDNINKRSKVDNGDILYAMIGTIGFPVLIETDKEFAIKNVALFKFKGNKVLLNKFLRELLNFEIIQNQIDFETKGSSRKFVSLSIFRK